MGLVVMSGHPRNSCPSIADHSFISSLVRGILGRRRAFVFSFVRIDLRFVGRGSDERPCYWGILPGPPRGKSSLGSVRDCTCSSVASAANSRSNSPSGVTSIHASSVTI